MLLLNDDSHIFALDTIMFLFHDRSFSALTYYEKFLYFHAEKYKIKLANDLLLNYVILLCSSVHYYCHLTLKAHKK